MNFTISEFRLPAGGADIDVVARMGTQVVYIQAKSTARAFASGKGKAALFDKDYKEWLKVAKKTTSEWNEIAEQSDESARRIWAYSGDIALPQKMVDHIRKLGGFVEKIDWGV